MKSLTLKNILNDIDDEPVFPGEMPFEMHNALQKAIDEKDMDLLSEAMRIAVRQTKIGIRERVLRNYKETK